jgi:hypothetical protein
VSSRYSKDLKTCQKVCIIVVFLFTSCYIACFLLRKAYILSRHVAHAILSIMPIAYFDIDFDIEMVGQDEMLYCRLDVCI